jgi:hypothetical protein
MVELWLKVLFASFDTSAAAIHHHLCLDVRITFFAAL